MNDVITPSSKEESVENKVDESRCRGCVDDVVSSRRFRCTVYRLWVPLRYGFVSVETFGSETGPRAGGIASGTLGKAADASGKEALVPGSAVRRNFPCI